ANAGTFRKSAGTLTTSTNLVFNNNAGGTVQGQSGTLSLTGGSTDAGGAFTVTSGNAIRFDGGVHTLSGSTFGGAGTYQLASGTVTVSAATSMPNLNFSGGTLDGTGTLTLAGASTGSGGTMAGTGFTTLGTLATLTLNNTASSVAQVGRTLANQGTIVRASTAGNTSFTQN